MPARKILLSELQTDSALALKCDDFMSTLAKTGRVRGQLENLAVGAPSCRFSRRFRTSSAPMADFLRLN